MRITSAIKLGEECGLETLGECIDNAIHSSTMFLDYDDIGEELVELENDVDKLAKKYNISIYDIERWTVKEWRLYEKPNKVR